RRTSGGQLVVPTPVGVEPDDLDPARTGTAVQEELILAVYETLTRQVEGARVSPWLASEVLAENEGRRFRFRLRQDVRFHDGSPLTARDVRYSFERLLGHSDSAFRHQLSVIRGAQSLSDARGGPLEGCEVVSATEFVLDLNRSVPFFPSLLTNSSTA